MRSSCLVTVLAAPTLLLAAGCAQSAGRGRGDPEDPAADGGHRDRPDAGSDAGGADDEDAPPGLACASHEGETDLDGDGIPVADDPRIDLAFWNQEGFWSGRGDLPVRTAGGSTMAELACPDRRADDCTPELVVVSGGRAGRFGALLAAPNLGPDAISDYRTGLTEDGTVWVLSYTSLWDSPHPGAIIDAWRLSVVHCGRARRVAEGGPESMIPGVIGRPGGGFYLRRADDETTSYTRWLGEGLEEVARGTLSRMSVTARSTHLLVTRDGRRRLIVDPPSGATREVLDAPAEGAAEGPFTLEPLWTYAFPEPSSATTVWYCVARDDGAARFVEIGARGDVLSDLGPVANVSCAGANRVIPENDRTPWAGYRQRDTGDFALMRLAEGETAPRLEGHPTSNPRLHATAEGWYATSGISRGPTGWLSWLPREEGSDAVVLIDAHEWSAVQLDVAADGRAAAIYREDGRTTDTVAFFDGARRVRELAFDEGAWFAGRGTDGRLRLIVRDGADDGMLRLVSAWETEPSGEPREILSGVNQIQPLSPAAPNLFAVCRADGVCGVHDLTSNALRPVPGETASPPSLLTRSGFDGVGPDGALWVEARVDGEVGVYALFPDGAGDRLLPGSVASLSVGLTDGPSPVPWLVAQVVGGGVEVRAFDGERFETMAVGEARRPLRRFFEHGGWSSMGTLVQERFGRPLHACLFDRRPAYTAFPADVGQVSEPVVVDDDARAWALLFVEGTPALWRSAP